MNKSVLEHRAWWMTVTGRRWSQALLIATLLLGSALRLLNLNADSLWADEVVTGTLARMDASTLLGIVSVYDDHPPLVYLIAHALSLFHDSDFVLRLPAAFAGILSISVLYVLGRRLWGASAGVLAAFLAAVWPTLIHYGQEARQYALLALFAAFSLYWLYVGLTQGKLWAWIGYTLATLAMLYTHYFGFLLLASQVVFALVYAVTRLSRPHGRRAEFLTRVAAPWVGALALIAVAYSPWYSALQTQSQRLLGNPGASPAQIPAMQTMLKVWPLLVRPSLRFFGEHHPLLVWGLVGAAVAGVAYGLWRKRSLAVVYLVITLVAPIFALSFISSTHFFHPRYLFPSLLLVLLFAAQGLAWLVTLIAARLRSSPQARPLAVLAVFALILVWVTPALRAYYREEKEDWRGVAGLLRQQAAPGDVIIGDGVFFGMGGDADRVRQGLGYYLRAPDIAIKAEPGLIAALPADPNATGAAWGVLWWQDRLADSRKDVARDFDLYDFKDLVVIRPKQLSGQVWSDAASVLEAMLRLQPLPETLPDLDLALAQLYLRSGQRDLAAQHVAAVAAIPLTDSRLLAALADLQAQLGAQ